MLHRAFSVFLFNEEGELLVQRRARSKVTFPLLWANTCCSHPLHVPEELEHGGGELGVRRAAQRKLAHELGIVAEDVPLDSLVPLFRVHYRARADDGVWGEHEVDYVLVALPPGPVRLAPHPGEVSQTRYVARADFDQWRSDVEAAGEKLSPWFRAIADLFLPRIWPLVEDFRRSQRHPLGLPAPPAAAGRPDPPATPEALLAPLRDMTILHLGDP